MLIPDFQTIMLPLLQFAADGQEHTQSEAVAYLAKHFNLPQEALEELLPSGRQATFDNRVAWAKSHLKNAGLLIFPRRARFKITDRGLSVLAQPPEKINMTFLKAFPEYRDFLTGGKSNDKDIGLTNVTADQEVVTPEEAIENGYNELRRALSTDLLDRVWNLSPARFERLVIDLLVKMGYGGNFKDAGTTTGKSGDEGIDGTIREDKLGLDMIYIQAKRWKQGNNVGRPEIQKFVGALAGQGAKKGIFITTSNFTKDARDYAPKNETKIVLIDGEELASLMLDYGVGVSVINTYEIKRIDSDYFGED